MMGTAVWEDSNFVFRCGGRTEEVARKEMIKGQKEEDATIALLPSRHNQPHVHRGYLMDNPVRLGLPSDVIDTGDYKDEFLDFQMSLHGFDPNPRKLIFPAEMEHVPVKYNFFSLKTWKVGRCLRLNSGIIHVHYSATDKPIMRCFSIQELKDITERLPPEYGPRYGGGGYWDIPIGVYNDWVDFNTLEPVDRYWKHLNKLIYVPSLQIL